MPSYTVTFHAFTTDRCAVVIDGIFDEAAGQKIQPADMPWNWGELEIPAGFRREWFAAPDAEKRAAITADFTAALTGATLLPRIGGAEEAQEIELDEKDDRSDPRTQSATAIVAGVVQRGGSLPHWLNLVFIFAREASDSPRRAGEWKRLTFSNRAEPVEITASTDVMPPEAFAALSSGETTYPAVERAWRTTLLSQAGSSCSAFELLAQAATGPERKIDEHMLIQALWWHTHPARTDHFGVPLVERSRGDQLDGPLHTLLRAASYAGGHGDTEARTAFATVRTLFGIGADGAGDGGGVNDGLWRESLWQEIKAHVNESHSAMWRSLAGATDLTEFLRAGCDANVRKEFLNELETLATSDEFLIKVLASYWDGAFAALAAPDPAVELIRSLYRDAVVLDSGRERVALRRVVPALLSGLAGARSGGSELLSDASLARCYQDCLAGSTLLLNAWRDRDAADGAIERDLDARITEATGALAAGMGLEPEAVVSVVARRHIQRLKGISAQRLPLSNPAPVVLKIPGVSDALQAAGWTKLGILARRRESEQPMRWCVLSSAALYWEKEDRARDRLATAEIVGRQTGQLVYNEKTGAFVSCTQEEYLQRPFFPFDGEVDIGETMALPPAPSFPQTMHWYDEGPLPSLKYLPESRYEFAYFHQHVSGFTAIEGSRWQRLQEQPAPADEPEHIQQVTDYRRRVPVGRPTLRMKLPESTGWLSPDRIPQAPPGMSLLGREVDWRAIGHPTAANLPVYLLSPLKSDRWHSRLGVNIQPPKTGFLNWRIWMQSENDPDLHALIDHAAALDLAARQAAADTKSAEQEQIPEVQLVDPAVYALKITVTGLMGEGLTTHEAVIVLPPRRAEDDAARQIERLLCPAEISWQFSAESPAPQEIRLAPGTIHRVTITPLLTAESWRRFDLPEEAHGEDPVELRKAAAEFLIEVAPASPALPSRAQVWDALWRGTETFGRAAEQENEIALTVSTVSDDWKWVSAGTCRMQTWRWAGLPENGSDLQQGAEHRPTDPVPDAGTGARWLQAEAASYAERPDEDALVRDFSVNVVTEVMRGEGFEIPVFRHRSDQLPRHHRFSIQLRHRYDSLYPASVTTTVWSGFDSAQGSVGWPQDTDWVRRISRGGIKRLPPPAIHMIVPLIDAEQTGQRAGFLVLLREELPTPFHELEATVATESYAARGVPAIGTWPVQESEGFKGGQPEAWPGRLVGLTYEGDKLAPRFAHLATAFSSPTALNPASDLYLRASFSWRLSANANAEGTKYIADRSDTWGLWLLGGFPQVAGVNLETLRFAVRDELPVFWDPDGREVLPAVPQASGLPAPGIEPGLLFVCWRNAPVGFGVTTARRTVGFYLLSPDGRHVSLLTGAHEPPDGGHFLLVQARPTKWREGANADDWIEKTFFGAPPTKAYGNRGDAQAVIARISKTIEVMNRSDLP